MAHLRVSDDDPDTFMAVLDDVSAESDLVITTEGISAGAFEVVRESLTDDGSTFLRLTMRPGGPQWYGRYANTPMLHFPGTPSGAYLAFHLFARSLIADTVLACRWRSAVFAGPGVDGHRKGASLIPGRFAADGRVVTGRSSRLRDSSGADAIIRVPVGPAAITAGDLVDVIGA